ncbi:ribosomal protein S18-alanine N-acetyltransferase [Halomonas sp. HNIBRBA4712]|uniref:ribosomal protein S18-alanine N-acetyltransferase n=1 Tax=Halomonas sp. HNIBRBA4712 TaxID=3373087 RepID=UPI0037453651
MICALLPTDLGALTALEAEAQSGASPRTLERGLVDDAVVMLGAWRKEALVGYALVARLPFEAELQMISVAPRLRGQGIGRALLEKTLAEARAWQSERLLLEVRAGNAEAIKLYQAAGFSTDGRRKNYYPAAGAAGREDALLMSRAL